MFLEDPRAVFPPPQRESDATEDLFVIMTGFTSSVMKSRSGLQTIRDDVAAGCMLPTPRMFAGADAFHTVSQAVTLI